MEPPPGGPWEFMMALGPSLGTLVSVSALRTDCSAPKHYPGPAPRPLFRVPWLSLPGWSLPSALSLHQQSPVTLGLSHLSF